VEFEDAIEAGNVTQEQARELFDALPSMDLDSLIGTWAGSEFPSGHPNDGSLSNSGWYGKRFLDHESVDPLLFWTADGKDLFAADPSKILSGMRSGKVADAQAEFETQQAKARLRMVEFRGVSTATMIYDNLPIFDHFRKVNEDTVLGAMDARGDAATYFFVLRRAR
jgi:hypothetical protein